MSIYQRLSAAMSPAAMIMAIFALVVAAAGAGFAAATIGTSDIKDNAVTTAKVKNGTLKAADMVKEKRFTYVDAAGAPNFSNGGQGDCVWESAHNELPGLPRAGFRRDRFGTVHLSGLVVGGDAPGGDGVCDGAEAEDLIVFRLPADYRPRKHVARVQPTGAGSGTLLIAGRGGLAAPGVSIPAGSVFWSGDPSFGLLLDGISYPAGDTTVFGRTAERSPVTAEGRALLKRFGIG